MLTVKPQIQSIASQGKGYEEAEMMSMLYANARLVTPLLWLLDYFSPFSFLGFFGSGFAELQTDMTDLTKELNRSQGIPFLEYKHFVTRTFFPKVRQSHISYTPNHSNSFSTKSWLCLLPVKVYSTTQLFSCYHLFQP